MFEVRFVASDAEGRDTLVGSALTVSSTELFDAIQLGRDVLGALGTLGLIGFKVADGQAGPLAHEEWL